MAAGYCYEGIPLRFLASLFDIQMRYLVYMRYLWLLHNKWPKQVTNERQRDSSRRKLYEIVGTNRTNNVTLGIVPTVDRRS